MSENTVTSDAALSDTGYQWLVRESSLHDIRATEFSAKDLGPGRPDSYEVSVIKGAKQGRDHAFYTVEIAIQAKNGDTPVAEVNFKLQASYHTGRDRPDIPFGELIKFGEERALADMQPYVRETAESLATRIGLNGRAVCAGIPSLRGLDQNTR